MLIRALLNPSDPLTNELKEMPLPVSLHFITRRIPVNRGKLSQMLRMRKFTDFISMMEGKFRYKRYPQDAPFAGDVYNKRHTAITAEILHK